MINSADKLRTHFNASSPDVRTTLDTVFDRTSGESRGLSLEEQHKIISSVKLNDEAPKEIQIHLETAKNCYLYAWFVYRFYQVAEQQACATLEFALRARFPEFVQMIISLNKKGEGKPPALGSLLKHAIDKKVLRNDLFPSRVIWAKRVAKARYAKEIHQRAMELDIKEYEFDDENVQPTEEDLATDWLANFLKHLPGIRNELAHGSSTIRDDVWYTFDVVCSMINMLYPTLESNEK